MELEFWFVNGDSIGSVYIVPGWGRVLVFDGMIDITQPFLFKSAKGDLIEHDVNMVDILRFVLPSKEKLDKLREGTS